VQSSAGKSLASGRFQQLHAYLGAIERREILGKRATDELGKGPRKFDAGGAPADDDEGQQTSTHLRVVLLRRPLEATQDPVP